MAEGKGVGFHITKTGAAKIATATALGQKVDINIAAFGDGGDFEGVWDYGRTKLNHEVVRKLFDSATDKYVQDSEDLTQIFLQVMVPETYIGPVTEIGFLDKDRDLIAYSVVPDKNEHVDIDTGVPIHTVYNALIKFEPDQVDTVQFNILQGDYRVLDEKLEKHLHSVYCAEKGDIDKLFGYDVDTGDPLEEPDPEQPPGPVEPGQSEPGKEPGVPGGSCSCRDLSLADSKDIDALF